MRKVESTVIIQAKPARVISAFTELTDLREWWGVERALIEKKPGGSYTLAWNIRSTGFGYVSTGIIKEYKPDSLLVIGNFVYMNPEISILGPMQLTIRALKKAGGTECYLCQEGYQEGADWDWYFGAVTGAWPIVLEELRKYLSKVKE